VHRQETARPCARRAYPQLYPSLCGAAVAGSARRHRDMDCRTGERIMTKLFSGIALAMGLMALSLAAQADPPSFTMDTKCLTPPDGMATIGDSHGDIAISPAGEIYVSVQGGDHAGIQVYSAQGRYLRNVPGAPTDLHGFIIAKGP